MLTIELDYGTVRIGQNSEQNWKIIDSANLEDYWFHIANCSSCHVVLSCNDKKYKLNNGNIKYLSGLCKQYTNKCKSINNLSINYTKIKNIKKGKYVGSVSIKNFKTIKI
jgi:predicted ribosome quality control (RQC) complex YloA/Tae2 family protein